jgi:TP901 family phage tail tape measure protein
MVLPSASEVNASVSSIERANRALAVQGEVLRGLGQKVQDWGKNTQWAGRQMMVGMTVPFAMAAGAAGMFANKIDQSMVRVMKVVDESLDGFRDKAIGTAKEISTTMGQTMESSLNVMGELAAAGFKGDQLQSMTKLSQMMATLGDMDQESSIKGLISIQKIFQMSTEDLADSVNYLNSVEDQTPTKLADLVDAIPIAGAQIAQLGGTLQDTTVLLTTFNERGIDTVEGANALKTSMNRIIAPTKQAAAVFKDLTGYNIADIVAETEGKPLETLKKLSEVIFDSNISLTDQQKIISKLVGTYQSSRFTSLLEGLADKNGAAAKAMDISSQSTAEWAARTRKALETVTESPSGQFKIAMESMKAEFLDVGQAALKMATWIVQGVTGIAKVFNSLPDFVQYILLGVGGLIALAGPVTMIAGIFGNFFGTLIKMKAFFTGMNKGYKSMTIEQKAAELAAGNLSTKMMSEAETTQVLVYQLDQLKAAYLETTAAAKGLQTAQTLDAIPTTGMLPLDASWNIGARAQQKGLSMPISGVAQSSVFAGNSPMIIGQMSEATANIAEETKKASKFQQMFKSETLLAAGGITAIGSMVTETGSGLSNWLTTISLVTTGLGAVMPIAGKVKEALSGSRLADAFSGLTKKAGEAGKGIGGKIVSGGKQAFSALGSFITGPWGLGIGAALAGIVGFAKLFGRDLHEALNQQRAITNSTDQWAEVLGRAKMEWGQIKDDSGKVRDDVNAIVMNMRDKFPELISSIQNARGEDRQDIIENEAQKLLGQGLSKDEVLKNLDALLQAAGLRKTEIEKILGNIDIGFDFSGGKKDLDMFLENTGKEIKDASNEYLFEMKVIRDPDDQDMDFGTAEKDLKLGSGEKVAGLFYDRLTNLDPAQKEVYTRQFTKNLSDILNDSFQELDQGKKSASTWAEAREKFFNFDKESGRWNPDDDAINAAEERGELTDEEIIRMTRLLELEQEYARAIARKLKWNDEQIKGVSGMKDLMKDEQIDPTVTAAEVQKAYNDTVREAKNNGEELTEEEKEKLAQLYAVAHGLDVAALMTNEYAKKNNDSAYEIQQNKKALFDFINVLETLPTDSVDSFWSAMTAGNQGFVDALGGTPLEQGQMLADQVKGIYSGAMNDIYSAMAAQAEEQWQARMDAITASFEARREAIQNQIDILDKQHDARKQKFDDDWDAIMDANEKKYEGEIELIQEQIDAEKERDDERQRQFEAEKKRIERLTELANRNIDYNRALASGNLDEAARIQNNAEAMTVSFGVDDERERASLLSEDSIKKKEAKIKALQDEEKAVKESLERQREAEKRAMDASMEMEKERLQNRLDSLSKEQQATESAERRKQEMNRRTLELELNTLKAFVPQNEAELNAHVARVSSAYGNYGINLQTAGGYWGQIIGNALTNNVNRARQEMSSNAAWSAFGSQVAGAISSGAFGLSLTDFFTLISTGQPPAGWVPPGAAYLGPNAQPGSRIHGARHAGGMIDGRPGSRNGRGNSPIGGDEGMYILQAGEYVFPKSAVQLYGSEYLDKLAAGTPPVTADKNVGVAGLGGGIAAVAGQNMIAIAMGRLWERAVAMFGGGGGTGAAVDFAKAQHGKPYIWGGVGPTGYDCSGYMSAIANVLTGQENIHRRIFSTGMVSPGRAFGPFVPGLGDIFSIGVRPGSHTAGTLMGVNVESTGDHVRYGEDAAGATDRQFTAQFHIPEDKIAAGAAMPGFGGFGGAETATGDVQQKVKAVASQFGWAGGEFWNSLSALIQKESSWNPNAANPRSSARGLFQKMTSIHGPLEPTIEGQAMWGLNYIKGRYGDPIRAWNFHKSRGWYDTGGDVHPGLTAVMNGTGRTETIITHKTRDQIISALDRAAVSYKGLEGVLRPFTPEVRATNFAPTGGDTYNNIEAININGSGLSQKELQAAITTGVENAKIRDNKRRGKYK